MDTIEGLKARIGVLEDEAKQKDARIAELRAEVDKGRTLVEEMRERVITSNEVIDSWIEAFGMTLGDDGLYGWAEGVQEKYDELLQDYTGLLRRWNKFVPKYNAVVAPRNIGRPLAASEAQQSEVLVLHKVGGKSLRWIAEATGLGLRTVRTITGKADCTDRTSVKREKLRRLELNRARMATWRARKRTRDGLPKRINETLKDGEELVKRAGVSRAR